MRKAIESRIINHGKHQPAYFQGCDTLNTHYDLCFTGGGTNAKEAYEDALDQACCDHLLDQDSIFNSTPKRPRGITKNQKLNAKELALDYQWYVSVLLKTVHVETCRSAFEDYILKEAYFGDALEIDSFGYYSSPMINNVWRGWKAAWKYKEK